MINVLIQTDFPDPVAPATRRCGIFAISETTTFPAPREHTVRTLSHGCMDPLFRATVEATHEAIVNALCAATDTDGILGRRMYALPLDEVRGIMRRYESL